MAMLTGTLMAISVSVTVSAQGVATPRQQAYVAPAEATLAQAVQEWSKQSGQAAPQVDDAVASLSVGNVRVTGSTVCEAVGRLVSALKYAETRPQMKSCGQDGAIVVASSAR